MNKKLIIIIVLLNVSLLYPISHAVLQMVKDWPEGYDATGVHWYVYDIYHAETHILNENSVGSYTQYSAVQNAARWTADVGNFPGGDWQEGDTIIGFGSWDSAYVTDPSGYGDNPNHTGFYWLFSDTLDADVDPQTLSPDDTLRPIPQPIAAQAGTNIEISVPNPAETRRVDQTTYDVLGYWFWADTTGTGIPNSYDKEVAFVPVQGGFGDTTTYSHPVAGNYENGQNVYWAYKLVAQPDTGGVSCPGYASYYLSANSNPIVIIGIEETQTSNLESQIGLQVYPNPFKHKTEISFSIGQETKCIELKIYDVSGRVVKEFNLQSEIYGLQSVKWDGTDQAGHKMPSGIYFCQIETENIHLSKQMTLLR